MLTRSFTQQEPFPVAVVTLATPESNRQEILFQTRYDVEGYNLLAKDIQEASDQIEYESEVEKLQQLKSGVAQCSTLKWAIKNLTVSLFRDWSVSRARIVLTCNLPSSDADIPALPNVQEFRGGNYPYLYLDDEIRIYAGYIDSPLTPITVDMLDEVPFPLLDNDGGELEGVLQPTKGTKLVPIFWGFIDKIDYDGSARGSGHQVILSCRDRVRVLSDTTLISVPSLSGVFGDTGSKTLPNGALYQIVSDVAKAVNGFQLNMADADAEDNICWKRIITPELKVSKKVNSEKVVEDLERASKLCEFYSAYKISNEGRASFQEEEDSGDPTRFVRRAAFKVMDLKSRPRFHMWLNRPPLAKEGGTAQWQVLDKTPLSIIKWIAIKEERPLDFFASHVNGDFCLVPRVLDVSGFKDPVRNYRTYFFRNWPKYDNKGQQVAPPCASQLILGLRTFSTIVGTFNRFTVVDNSNTAGAGLSVLQSVKLTIDRIPYTLEGRNITPPCRLKLIYDGGLGTYQNPYGGALIVAMSVSSQVSRDVSGVEFKVLGDPTFFPGEAVRVYNTFLHDQGFLSQTGRYADVINKQSKYDAFQQKFNDTPADAKRFAGNEAIMKTSDKDNNTIRELNLVGTIETDRRSLQLPVYKIRSIEHKITTQGKNAGYITTVLASMDLNN